MLSAAAEIAVLLSPFFPNVIPPEWTVSFKSSFVVHSIFVQCRKIHFILFNGKSKCSKWDCIHAKAKEKLKASETQKLQLCAAGRPWQWRCATKFTTNKLRTFCPTCTKWKSGYKTLYLLRVSFRRVLVLGMGSCLRGEVAVLSCSLQENVRKNKKKRKGKR